MIDSAYLFKINTCFIENMSKAKCCRIFYEQTTKHKHHR